MDGKNCTIESSIVPNQDQPKESVSNMNTTPSTIVNQKRYNIIDRRDICTKLGNECLGISCTSHKVEYYVVQWLGCWEVCGWMKRESLVNEHENVIKDFEKATAREKLTMKDSKIETILKIIRYKENFDIKNVVQELNPNLKKTNKNKNKNKPIITTKPNTNAVTETAIENDISESVDEMTGVKTITPKHDIVAEVATPYIFLKSVSEITAMKNETTELGNDDEEVHELQMSQIFDKGIATMKNETMEQVTIVGQLNDKSTEEISNPQQKEVENCRHYLNGYCRRGKKCFFRHPKNIEMRICNFYVERGYCKFGDDCKFRHPDSVEETAIATPVLEYLDNIEEQNKALNDDKSTLINFVKENKLNDYIKKNDHLKKENNLLKLEIEHLKKENDLMKDENVLKKDALQIMEAELKTKERLCTICLFNEIQVVFLPCGHFCTCFKCALKDSLKTCPICRVSLERKIKTYFS